MAIVHVISTGSRPAFVHERIRPANTERAAAIRRERVEEINIDEKFPLTLVGGRTATY